MPAIDTSAYWKRLAYRWFVEFNPLYLLSAALVLGGCSLWSYGVGARDDIWSLFGGGFIAEIYAACLLGGAAFLHRIGQRRPAVLLTLLVVLYQWDLTLHTETCSYLGVRGALGDAAWLGAFVSKLAGIAWAMRVRLSRQVVSAALVAALGLVLGPFVLSHLGPNAAGSAVALWVFALGSLYREEGITSALDLSPWGLIALRRVTRAVWGISGVLLGIHVLFWTNDHAIALAPLCPVVPLLLAARSRDERQVWALVLGAAFTAAFAFPAALATTCALAALPLVMRAHAESTARAPARLLTGAVAALYLSLWTRGWSGGSWPAHALWLDIALTAAIVLVVATHRLRSALVPLGLTYAHFVLQAHLIPAPHSTVQWGASIIALGFVLLGGSLAVSYALADADTT